MKFHKLMVADDHPVFEIRVPSSAPTSLPDQQEIHQP
jgi:hypothetical protein